MVGIHIVTTINRSCIKSYIQPSDGFLIVGTIIVPNSAQENNGTESPYCFTGHGSISSTLQTFLRASFSRCLDPDGLLVKSFQAHTLFQYGDDKFPGSSYTNGKFGSSIE